MSRIYHHYFNLNDNIIYHNIINRDQAPKVRVIQILVTLSATIFGLFFANSARCKGL